VSNFTEISRAKTESPPTEPIVQCLNCSKNFVWWVHPVQLCDECVTLEYAKAEMRAKTGRTWKLWGHADRDTYWHVGARRWVELLDFACEDRCAHAWMHPPGDPRGAVALADHLERVGQDAALWRPYGRTLDHEARTRGEDPT
jgi:hypothetical protein